MRRAAVFAGALLLTCPTAACAHGRRANPDFWWLAWDWDPLVLLTLGVLAAVYARGIALLWRETGTGRVVARWQAGAFALALVIVAVALLSPVDAMATDLSSLHMVQHMLLMTAAAPLAVLGSPMLVLAWGLRGGARERVPALITPLFRAAGSPALWHPLVAWSLFALALWSWHHPLLYQAALRDPLVHDAQHVSFFSAACLFWRTVLDPLSVRRLSAIAAVPYLFATSLHASALGVFLAFSSEPWYADYANTAAWGLTPLADQQLAGFIMWMPACLIFPAAAALLMGAWLARASSTPRRYGPKSAIRRFAVGG